MNSKLTLLMVFLVFSPLIVLGSPIDLLQGNASLLETYQENSTGIDFIIYLLVFGSVLNATVADKFGRGASLGIALALSIAMAAFSQQQGFSIGDFWYISIIVIISVILGLIYKHLSGANLGEHKMLFISIGYIALYIVFFETIEKIEPYFFLDYHLLNLFLQIFLVIAIIYLVYAIPKALKTK